MKKTVVLILLCIYAISSSAQISAIKKQLCELYFEISFPSSKYEIRKLMNSDNFTTFSEVSFEKDVLTALFKDNYKLQYYKTSNHRSFDYWFQKNSDVNYCVGLELRFLEVDESFANKQYYELISFFKDISYKTTIVGDEITGTDAEQYYYFYSSASAVQKKLSYLIVTIKYIPFKELASYAVSTSYYPSHLF